MTVADRIKDRREKLGMSQEELARRLGLKDKSSISKIESSGDKVSLKNIEKIAPILKCTVQYLMGWDEKTDKKEKTIMDDGLVIHEKTTDEDKAQTMQLFEMILNLDPGLRAEAIDYILFLSQRERKDAHLRTKIQRIEVLGQVPVDSERLLRNPSKALSHYRELTKRKEESSQ